MIVTCSIRVSKVNVYINDTAILRDIDLDIGPNGLHGIIGPNGAGKTTLLRVLAGIIGFDGSITICGLKPREAHSLISYVPSIPQTDPWARVIDILFASRYGLSGGLTWRKLDRVAVEDAVKLTGIEMFLHRTFGELSSGEQRLVCIARALARKPRVLLLDEPLAFLDVHNQYRIMNLLLQVSQNSTVIMSMHDLSYIHLFKTITVLYKGGIAYHGSPENVTRRLLEKIYNVRLGEAILGSKRVYIPLL